MSRPDVPESLLTLGRDAEEREPISCWCLVCKNPSVSYPECSYQLAQIRQEGRPYCAAQDSYSAILHYHNGFSQREYQDIDSDQERFEMVTHAYCREPRLNRGVLSPRQPSMIGFGSVSDIFPPCRLLGETVRMQLPPPLREPANRQPRRGNRLKPALRTGEPANWRTGRLADCSPTSA